MISAMTLLQQRKENRKTPVPKQELRHVPSARKSRQDPTARYRPTSPSSPAGRKYKKPVEVQRPASIASKNGSAKPSFPVNFWRRQDELAIKLSKLGYNISPNQATWDLRDGIAKAHIPANDRRFRDELSAVSWDDVQDISTTDKNEC